MGLPHDPSAVAVLHRRVRTFAEISHQKDASGGCEQAVPQHRSIMGPHGRPACKQLHYVRRSLPSFPLAAGAEYVSLEQLLQESDVSGVCKQS